MQKFFKECHFKDVLVDPFFMKNPLLLWRAFQMIFMMGKWIYYWALFLKPVKLFSMPSLAPLSRIPSVLRVFGSERCLSSQSLQNPLSHIMNKDERCTPTWNRADRTSTMFHRYVTCLSSDPSLSSLHCSASGSSSSHLFTGLRLLPLRGVLAK